VDPHRFVTWRPGSKDLGRYVLRVGEAVILIDPSETGDRDRLGPRPDYRCDAGSAGRPARQHIIDQHDITPR
jgi:hypothetical protein